MRKKAALERLVKEVLEVPVDKAVRMTFKAAGHKEKLFVAENYMATQLSAVVTKLMTNKQDRRAGVIQRHLTTRFNTSQYSTWQLSGSGAYIPDS